MKLVTFRREEELKLGVKVDQGIIDVAEALKRLEIGEGVPQRIADVLHGGEKALNSLKAVIDKVQQSESGDFFLKEDEVKLGPCVPNPGKVICIGLNYRKHAEESKMPVPEYPVLFNKFNTSISAHGEHIFLPSDAYQIDYEAELGIVIGKQAKKVSKEDALDYVLGYCNANDLSARDLQFRTNQWLLGKCLDGFSPIGPYLVTAEEVGNPNDLVIHCYVNGEIRQHSNTADMIFPCDYLVSYISQYITLEPGDIILTGTPEGVILGYPEDKRVWLQDGDEVTIEIDKLGRLTNVLKRE